MVLFTVAGYAAATFADVESGVLMGVLVGFVVAPFVPLPDTDADTED